MWVVIIVIGPSRLYIEALVLLWVTSVCSSNSSWPLTWSTTDVSSQLMGGDLLHMLCYSWLHCHLRAENGSIKYRIHNTCIVPRFHRIPLAGVHSVLCPVSIWSSQYSPGHSCSYMIHHESYPLVVAGAHGLLVMVLLTLDRPCQGLVKETLQMATCRKVLHHEMEDWNLQVAGPQWWVDREAGVIPADLRYSVTCILTSVWLFVHVHTFTSWMTKAFSQTSFFILSW